MSRYYDRQGREISMDEWARTFGDADVKIVKKTDVTDDVTVSTVWLGIDHNWGGGPPLIFETLIFGGPLDQEMWRYSTEEEALAGHEQAALTSARYMSGWLADGIASVRTVKHPCAHRATCSAIDT